MIGAALRLPLVGSDKLVFATLCEYANDTTRTCWPSYATIRMMATLSNSSLKTALEVLTAVGLISIAIRSTSEGGRRSSLYKIPEFDSARFDVNNYKKIAKEIRGVRNCRAKKDTQSPKINRAENYPNLRKSIQSVEGIQTPKIDTSSGIQIPNFGEEPLASSFEPLAIEEEEEVCITEIVTVSSAQALLIPSSLSHIPISTIEKAIDRAVAKLARKSPARYRLRLQERLAMGDEYSIATIMEFVKQIENLQNFNFSENHAKKRKIGQLISQLVPIVSFMREQNITENDISIEIEILLRSKIREGKISKHDLPKIYEDLSLALGELI